MSSPTPVEPTASGFSMRSVNLPIPLFSQATQTLTSLLALPIQVNRVASYCAPFWPSRGSNAAPRLLAPSAVPSLGAAL